MSEILNAFNNSWPFVQIVMLMALVALVALPVWLIHRWLSLRKTLPDNILLALAQDGDRVTLTVTKGAPITPNQLTGLLTEPASRTDINAEPSREDSLKGLIERSEI